MIPRTSVEKGVRRGVEKNLKQINSKVETRYTRVQIVFPIVASKTNTTVFATIRVESRRFK